MFKFEEICELIQLVGSSGVSSVEVEHAGSRLRIDGAAQVVAVPAAAAPGASGTPAPPPVEATTAPAPAAGQENAAAEAEEGLSEVTSPIVGTFYRAPNPDADPYVKVGDFVESGQTLCIVEAMKLMNEIESDVSGTVVKVMPENAQPVEYGERLFMIRPA